MTRPDVAYSYVIRVIWACLRRRGADAFQVPTPVACVVQGGRAPVGTSDPLRQRHGKVNRTWDTSSAKVMLTCHSLAHIQLFVFIHKCTLSLFIVIVYIYYECWVRLCYLTSNEAIKFIIVIAVSMCLLNLPSNWYTYCLKPKTMQVRIAPRLSHQSAPLRTGTK